MFAPLKSIKHTRSGQKGFTLVEAMLGLAVFSVGILAVAGMKVVTMNTNTAANASTKVTNESVGTVERVFSMNWDAASAQSIPCTAPQPAGPAGELEVSWCITEAPTAGTLAMTDEAGRPTVRLITVTITDPDGKGGRRNSTLRLLKPKM